MRPAATALVVALLAMTGCASQSAPPPSLSAEVFETRFDPPLGQLHLRVLNESSQSVRVLSADLDSTAYPASTGFTRPQTVPSGAARDLPVPLGAPACPDGDEASALAQTTVRVVVESPDGSSQELSLPVLDTTILAATLERDCRGDALATHATVAPPPALTWTPGAGAPATLEFSVSPTDATGSATINSVGPTTLLGIVDAAGARATPLTLDVVIDAETAPFVLPVRIVPARCDPHAIAEDKQGTLIPFDIATSEGESGQVRIAVSDEVRAQIYAFVTDFCAATGG